MNISVAFIILFFISVSEISGRSGGKGKGEHCKKNKDCNGKSVCSHEVCDGTVPYARKCGTTNDCAGRFSLCGGESNGKCRGRSPRGGHCEQREDCYIIESACVRSVCTGLVPNGGKCERVEDCAEIETSCFRKKCNGGRRCDMDGSSRIQCGDDSLCFNHDDGRTLCALYAPPADGAAVANNIGNGGDGNGNGGEANGLVLNDPLT